MSLEGKSIALKLAGDVCNCPEVAKAFSDSSHPCHKVVNEQKVGPAASTRQRPEPWFGNLQDAQVLFVSSNPGLNTNPGEQSEIFPNLSWSPEKSASFFVDRITDSADSPVTFNKPGINNFLTLCVDGEYRNEGKKPFSPQSTWNGIYQRAIELLGEIADPRFNFALTEVVHCKSNDGQGAPEAAAFCSSNWMKPILEFSPAKLVVLLGSHVRNNFAYSTFNLDSNFGSAKKGESLTPVQRIVQDTFVSDYARSKRIYIYNAHPTSSETRTLNKVYGDYAVSILGKIAKGELALPSTTSELHELLIGLK